MGGTVSKCVRSLIAGAVYVDAQKFGTILRFVNHSCNPNTNFYEAAFGYRHTIVVVATRDIAADEEITISYGDPKKLWFACHCGEENCVDREHTTPEHTTPE